MKITKDLYQSNLVLLTDFYQLTMAYAYWKSGKGEQEAVFNLFFRKNPFEGGFTLAAGLDYVVDFCRNFKFDAADLTYLREMKHVDIAIATDGDADRIGFFDSSGQFIGHNHRFAKRKYQNCRIVLSVF